MEEYYPHSMWLLFSVFLDHMFKIINPHWKQNGATCTHGATMGLVAGHCHCYILAICLPKPWGFLNPTTHINQSIKFL